MVIDEASIPNWDDVSEFQFQIGAIKRRLCGDGHIRRYRFNSKLVRLKDSDLRAYRVKEGGFNSKLVRLKGVQSKTF